MTRLTAKEKKVKDEFWNNYLKECEEEIAKEKKVKEVK